MDDLHIVQLGFLQPPDLSAGQDGGTAPGGACRSEDGAQAAGQRRRQPLFQLDLHFARALKGIDRGLRLARLPDRWVDGGCRAAAGIKPGQPPSGAREPARATIDGAAKDGVGHDYSSACRCGWRTAR